MPLPDDPIMLRITEAISLLHRGDRAEARAQFEAIWGEIKNQPTPLHVCTLSHYMADLQEDSRMELLWDLRALRAARRTTTADTRAHHPSLAIESFFPSLHLNVAYGYFALGRHCKARQHVEAGLSALRVIPENPYLLTIHHGLERLARRVADSC
jgi:hypothetical protein